MKKNLNGFFRKDLTYENIKRHEKPGLRPLSRRSAFGKTTEGGGVNFNNKPSCETLSKAFDMSRKTPLTSQPSCFTLVVVTGLYHWRSFSETMTLAILSLALKF